MSTASSKSLGTFVPFKFTGCLNEKSPSAALDLARMWDTVSLSLHPNLHLSLPPRSVCETPLFEQLSPAWPLSCLRLRQCTPCWWAIWCIVECFVRSSSSLSVLTWSWPAVGVQHGRQPTVGCRVEGLLCASKHQVIYSCTGKSTRASGITNCCKCSIHTYIESWPYKTTLQSE